MLNRFLGILFPKDHKTTFQPHWFLQLNYTLSLIGIILSVFFIILSYLKGYSLFLYPLLVMALIITTLYRVGYYYVFIKHAERVAKLNLHHL
ncbi:MAG: hypothetical protein DRR19_24455 [Candidatus Parabeggiatoa sp. nov. 1]|jgi:hypothetical protein|nr:MAG: hypothetical protein DRR19_24455 [Gammaproteobacteria bacterium]